MKVWGLITGITIFLLTASVSSARAQSSGDANTSSARAAYGIRRSPTVSHKVKKKKKEHKRKQAKAIREREVATRKRNNWAG